MRAELPPVVTIDLHEGTLAVEKQPECIAANVYELRVDDLAIRVV